MKAIHFTISERQRLPDRPGIYQFYNKAKENIYIGKAKCIRKRVSSYFRSQDALDIKTRQMVSQIASIAFTIVYNESDAFLLENNLIKQLQPRYNILLKDHKTYPYLCITDEPFPRLVYTRQRDLRLGQYFGPFTDGKAVEQVQKLVRELYTLRSCALDLSARQIKKRRFRVCLEYHIGRCLGPCEGRQGEGDYLKEVAEVVQLLKGNFSLIKKNIKTKMYQAAQVFAFEEAQRCKERLGALEAYQARSIIIHPRWGDMDVIAIVSDTQGAFVNYLHIQQGSMVFAETLALQKKLQETDEELLLLALYHFRERSGSSATQLLCNITLVDPPRSLEVSIPKVGEKARLVDMALQNALFFKKEQLNKKSLPIKASRSVLMHLQQDLHLKEVPMHIECFDNSNLQGSYPVAAMVCFKRGKPAKKSYRHFHIKTVEGADDFASMREVIRRRYTRVQEEGDTLPDLILIDGGKGQLSAAVDALKEVGIYGQVTVISIAKKLEALYYPNDPHPLYLSKKSPALRLLQRIRNEAHRFAITFHRQKRMKATLRSVLQEIPGIGSKTIDRLFQHFGAIDHMEQASTTAMAEQVGQQKALLIYDYFHPSEA